MRLLRIHGGSVERCVAMSAKLRVVLRAKSNSVKKLIEAQFEMEVVEVCDETDVCEV